MNLRSEPENYRSNLLDFTLRHLYNTLRKVGGELMAIEFKHKGTLWRADTAEEAVALRNELERADKVHIPQFDTMDRLNEFWTPDRFMDAINGIGDLQRRLLVAVRLKPKITSKELVQDLGLDSEVALAGVVSGLSKQLKQLGIEVKDVLGVEVKWSGKTKTRRFLLDDFFLGAGEDQGWPEAWERKPKQPSHRRRANALENPRATNAKRPKTKKASD